MSPLTIALTTILVLSVLGLSIPLLRADYSCTDDFDDGTADGWTANLGSWWVSSKEYQTSVGIVENGISTLNGVNYTDCVIETQLRFIDSIGYRAGIIFRYTDDYHYYSFEIGNEYDEIDIIKYSPANPNYGASRAVIAPNAGNSSITINANVNYTLRIAANGPNFTAFLDGQNILNWTDNSYSSGLVGLRARAASVAFDNFKVGNYPQPTPSPTPSLTPTLTPSPSPSYTPTPTITPSPPISPNPVHLISNNGNSDFPSIQAAINSASAGDFIFAESGLYSESVNINKDSLKIFGNNGTSFLQGTFTITANHIFLTGFTILGNEQLNGIYLNNVNNCYISNNTVSNTSIGILLDQNPSLLDTAYASNSIVGNNLFNNAYGIKSSFNFNVAPDNIYADSFLGNQIINNTYGIWLYTNINSASPKTYDGYIISGNNISSNTYAININWNINSLTLNKQNITLGGNTIKGNHFANNNFIFETNGNINSLNTYGTVDICFDNHIYGNNFIANSQRNSFAMTIALWNLDTFDGKTTTFFNFNIGTINVGTYNGYLWSFDISYWDNVNPIGGNHWSNYVGIDANDDGIGDSPFGVSTNNIDRYPLMYMVTLGSYPLIPDWAVLPDPTITPSPTPSSSPTTNPTSNPTTNPTTAPTSNPTTSHTSSPTQKPTTNPTSNPSPTPSVPEFPALIASVVIITATLLGAIAFKSKQTKDNAKRI